MVRRREGQRMTALLEGVLENAPVGLGFLDRNLNIRHMNQALESISGARRFRSRHRCADLGAAAIAPGRTRPEVTAARDQGLVTTNVEVAVPTPSAPGRYAAFPDEFLPSPRQRKEGLSPERWRRSRCCGRTLSRLSEARTRESEERFRSLTEATAAIVWTTTPDGDFRQVTSEWTRFTGQIPTRQPSWAF